VFSLCFRCVFVVFSLCFRCVFVVFSLCFRCVFVVFSLCFCCVFVVFSLCFRCVFVVCSLCFCCVFVVFLLCSRCVFVVFSLFFPTVPEGPTQGQPTVRARIEFQAFLGLTRRRAGALAPSFDLRKHRKRKFSFFWPLDHFFICSKDPGFFGPEGEPEGC
jgi:hypothetical protein